MIEDDRCPKLTNSRIIRHLDNCRKEMIQARIDRVICRRIYQQKQFEVNKKNWELLKSVMNYEEPSNE